MNDEFAWRNKLRKLGGDVEPVRDLWPAIGARIASRATHNWRAGLGLAAALVGVAAVSVFAWRMQSSTAPATAMTVATPASVHSATTAPLAWAIPADPTLAAAAHDLDNATVQLQQALERDPQAVFLVGLLNRTNGQRMRLLRQSAFAG